MSNKSVILYDDDFRYAERLSDSQKAVLFTALLKYRFHGEHTNFDDDLTLYILYNQIVEHISQNETKYKETCEKRSEAIKKRWSAEKAGKAQKNTKVYLTIVHYTIMIMIMIKIKIMIMIMIMLLLPAALGRKQKKEKITVIRIITATTITAVTRIKTTYPTF